jgi:hypothetical protein
MMVLTYDIMNGQFVNKELKPTWTININCNEAIIIGETKRRMYDELLECYRDVTAFYIRYGAAEYGVIGMTIQQYIALCKGTVVCKPRLFDCDPAQIFECIFEDIFE